jgi:hypothetical protein
MCTMDGGADITLSWLYPFRQPLGDSGARQV